MTPARFEAQWLLFAKSQFDTLEPDALEAARKVFYVGGAAAFGVVTTEIAEMDDEAACAAMDRLQDEFTAFIRAHSKPEPHQ